MIWSPHPENTALLAVIMYVANRASRSRAGSTLNNFVNLFNRQVRLGFFLLTTRDYHTGRFGHGDKSL
jgi:hypothetical protein